MFCENDKRVIGELSRRYREIAENEVNRERKQRLTRTNDLTSGLRPGVWIDEIPWHEMEIDGKLKLKCQDPFARNMEWFFRTTLFRWEYFQADMVVETFYPIAKSYSSTGNGLHIQEDIKSTDQANHIVSHAYIDSLKTEEDLARIHEPIITPHPEKDKKNAELASELLNGVLPVKFTGTPIYYVPWDEISMLRGVEPILYDMIDRPEFLHQIMEKYTANQKSYMLQLEKYGLLEDEPEHIHCTPPYTKSMPPKEADGKVRLKNVWFRGTAQMFSTVSPEQHEEFEMTYIRPLMEMCGLAYYGCCEPLERNIPFLKTVPNMRKIGVSPWADIESCAEQIQGDYVYARKPNPAKVAACIDSEAIKKEIEDTIKVCIRYGCPYEFVLKDISTVSYKPGNLIEWNRIVQETIDKFYK
ncbi:MAG: hypothetical protein KH921_20965 [Erysipelotrichaceae bacterium]|nr:hypothetical protein [Erysipelotrichaceae bacterium]